MRKRTSLLALDRFAVLLGNSIFISISTQQTEQHMESYYSQYYSDFVAVLEADAQCDFCHATRNQRGTSSDNAYLGGGKGKTSS